MNRYSLWGVSGLAVAMTLALVIVPSSVGSSADQGGAQSVSEVSTADVAAASAADEDDPESVEAPPPAVVAIAGAASARRLTDGMGRTLYVFSLDTPGKSTCVGMCQLTWSPARSLGGKPQPGTDVTASSVGNIQRPDGSEQMTYNGYPVYYYSGDDSPGQSNGAGRSEFGGLWSAQPPASAGGPK